MEEEKEKRKNLKEAEKAISAERRFVNLSEWQKRDVHLFCRFFLVVAAPQRPIHII